MLRPSSTTALALLAATAVVLSGCTTQSPEQQPTGAQQASAAEDTSNVQTDTSGSNYSKDVLDTISPRDFADLDVTTRLDWGLDELLKYRADARGIVLKYSDDKQTKAVNDTSSKEQVILNNYAIDLACASAQEQGLEGTDRGMKLLSIVMSPDNQNFDATLSRTAEVGTIINVYRARPDLKYRTIANEQVMDEEIGPNGAEVIRATRLNDDEEVTLLFQKYISSDGKEAYMMTNNYNTYNAPQLDYELQRMRVR